MSKKNPQSHIAYRALTALRLPRIMRMGQSGARVFCLHNVVASDEAGRGDSSLHMPVSHFEELMRWTAATYDVVPMTELLERLRTGRSVRGIAVLTFDDAYEGFFRHAVAVLARLRLPSTLFVVPSAAERPSEFWWDRLAETGRLSGPARDRHLARDRGLAREVLGDGDSKDDAVMLPDSYLPATWEVLAAHVGESDLLTVGSHTLSHPNLTRMTDEELALELGDARREIESKLGIDPEVVSYPYGLHDERVHAFARDAGYRAGLTLDPSLARPGRDPLTIPRLNVPATIGLEAFECWASGVQPRGGI